MVTLSLLIRLKGKRNYKEVYFIFVAFIYVFLVIVYILYSFYLIN